MHHSIPRVQVGSPRETTPPPLCNHLAGQQEQSPAVQICCSVGPFFFCFFFLGMRQHVIWRGRDRGQRHVEMFQFVSLVLSSVCLSWRRVMRDSHAAWHCRGWRWMSKVNRGGKKIGEREKRTGRDGGRRSDISDGLWLSCMLMFSFRCILNIQASWRVLRWPVQSPHWPKCYCVESLSTFLKWYSAIFSNIVGNWHLFCHIVFVAGWEGSDQWPCEIWSSAGARV